MPVAGAAMATGWYESDFRAYEHMVVYSLVSRYDVQYLERQAPALDECSDAGVR